MRRMYSENQLKKLVNITIDDLELEINDGELKINVPKGFFPLYIKLRVNNQNNLRPILYTQNFEQYMSTNNKFINEAAEFSSGNVGFLTVSYTDGDIISAKVEGLIAVKYDGDAIVF